MFEIAELKEEDMPMIKNLLFLKKNTMETLNKNWFAFTLIARLVS